MDRRDFIKALLGTGASGLVAAISPSEAYAVWDFLKREYPGYKESLKKSAVQAYKNEIVEPNRYKTTEEVGHYLVDKFGNKIISINETVPTPLSRVHAYVLAKEEGVDCEVAAYLAIGSLEGNVNTTWEQVWWCDFTDEFYNHASAIALPRHSKKICSVFDIAEPEKKAINYFLSRQDFEKNQEDLFGMSLVKADIWPLDTYIAGRRDGEIKKGIWKF